MTTQKTPRFKAKVTLSKTSKRIAATIVDAHDRGAFVRAMLNAEHSAFMSRFAKSSRDNNNG